MKKTGTIFALLFLCLSATAQEGPRPFAAVDAGLSARNPQKPDVSTIFQSERERLGESFEQELWKYLGDDVNKLDTISNFLVYPGYLHGSMPMPYLALQVQNKALAILRDKTDIESRGTSLTIHVNAAGLSAEMEMRDQAEFHKRNAERLAVRDFFLYAAFFPARTQYEICVYEAIADDDIKGTPATACADQKNAEEKQQPAIIQAGEIPPEKIVARPEPLWPAAGRAAAGKGTVAVAVTIDETGKVESARAISGPSALQTAAVNAARKARFQKTQYRGVEVKVNGRLVYKF